MTPIDHAVHFLACTRPEMSAAAPVTGAQRLFFAGALAVIVGMVGLAPGYGIEAALIIFTIPFSCISLIRAAALLHLLRFGTGARTVARDMPPVVERLPAYSLLVPLYREAGVVKDLIAALAALDYPRDRLEVLFITEADDEATRAALQSHVPNCNMRVLTVPDGAPRTKPRALNYALTFAKGEFVAVFDAEDAPHPGQLKAAVAAFRAGGQDLACVQARLNIYNPGRNFFTRQFTLEYSALFDAILPALAWLRLPLPLGGTSNHFPRAALIDAGAWDPYNVTEDADLGVRLARLGMRTEMLAAVTWEEAPASLSSWFGQRTRWIKGWMRPVNSNILLYEPVTYYAFAKSNSSYRNDIATS